MISESLRGLKKKRKKKQVNNLMFLHPVNQYCYIRRGIYIFITSAMLKGLTVGKFVFDVYVRMFSFPFV